MGDISYHFLGSTQKGSQNQTKYFLMRSYSILLDSESRSSKASERQATCCGSKGFSLVHSDTAE